MQAGQHRGHQTDRQGLGNMARINDDNIVRTQGKGQSSHDGKLTATSPNHQQKVHSQHRKQHQISRLGQPDIKNPSDVLNQRIRGLHRNLVRGHSTKQRIGPQGIITGFGLDILQFFGHALHLGHILHAEALAAEHRVIVE